MVTQEQVKLVSTGNPEIDEKLEGGIPQGSLVLLEGAVDTGKSLIAQHFTHATLRSGVSVAHYSTKDAIKELMSQMTSLGLDVTDYFLCDRLRVYPISSSNDANSGEALNSLLEHFESLPIDSRLIVVDALTDFTTPSNQRQSVDFFAACKQLCDLGRTMILVMQSNADGDESLERLRAICDTQLVLEIDQQDEPWARVMTVVKLNNRTVEGGSLVHFSVDPSFGLKVLSPTGTRR